MLELLLGGIEVLNLKSKFSLYLDERFFSLYAVSVWNTHIYICLEPRNLVVDTLSLRNLTFPIFHRILVAYGVKKKEM